MRILLWPRISVKYVEGVSDPGQRAFDVRERQSCEIAKAIRLLRNQVGCVFVYATRHLTPFRVFPTDNARRCKGQHTGCDLLRVHECKRAFGTPIRAVPTRRITAVLRQSGGPERRHDMLVNIYTIGACHWVSPL
jgi:hypothetical protein